MRHKLSYRSLLSPALLALPLAIAGAVLISAPSRAADEAPGKAAEKPAAAGKAAKPAVAWKDMSEEQKGKFMKDVIVPKMKPLFQEFDGKKFAKFNCASCHGKDPKDRKFKMPAPAADVHPLPGTPEGFKAAMEKNAEWPKWTKFMGEKVKPQMATLLGLPEFDPKNPAAGGFGCMQCHSIEK
jgi:hypothetical protein